MKKKSPKKKGSFSYGTIIKVGGAAIALAVVILGALLIVLPQAYYTTGFETISDLNQFAQQHEELVPLESDNAVKPEFGKYYERFKPGVVKTMKRNLRRIGELLHLAKKPLFSPSFFKAALDDVNKMRATRGYKKKSVELVQASVQSTFICFGDLQSAFHSLVLDLNKIKELGYLDEKLVLTKPDSYLVFLGNVVNRAPHTMETLAVVLQLLRRNPDRVLYTKGSHESEGYWQEHTLKTELKLRAADLSKETIPLEPEITTFFNTVTFASYIAMPTADKNAFVRVSRLDRAEMSDQCFAPFLLGKPSGTFSVFGWDHKGFPDVDANSPQVNIKAILKVEKKRETYQPNEGLRLMEPDMGATTWTLISCPTLAYEKALKFHNDAFAIVQAGAQLTDWTIELYWQSRLDRKGFQTKKFYFLSGEEITGGARASQAATSQAAATPQVVQPVAAKPVEPQQAPAAPQPAQSAPVQQPAVVEQKPVTEQKAMTAPAQSAPTQAPAPQSAPTTQTQAPTSQPAPAQAAQPAPAPAPQPAATQPVPTQSQTPAAPPAAVAQSSQPQQAAPVPQAPAPTQQPTAVEPKQTEEQKVLPVAAAQPVQSQQAAPAPQAQTQPAVVPVQQQKPDVAQQGLQPASGDDDSVIDAPPSLTVGE